VSDFNLTSGQAQAWAAIQQIVKLPREAKPKVLIVAGFAGTGKTTLMKIARDFFGGCVICTPTGKAALRVKEATGLEATTFHRWLYDADTDQKTGKPVFKRKEQPYVPRERLLVIDEGSMVGEDDWEEIYETCAGVGMNIVVLGDAFQLPPVAQRADGPAFSLLSPNFAFAWKRVEMTEIVRQALDRPLVRASMLIREGTAAAVCDAMMLLDRLPKTKDVPEASAEILARGGTTICHTNAGRNALNRAVRRLVVQADAGRVFDGVFHDDFIYEGEPLLVTFNNYDLDYFNGEVVALDTWLSTPGNRTFEVRDRFTGKSTFTQFGRARVNGRECVVGVQEVLGLTTPGVGFKAYKKTAEREYDDELPYLNANLGYALTCHKSQGSEWPEVLVVLEKTMGVGRMGNDHAARRWLYTSITRAKERAWYTTWDAPPEKPQ
jgi:exodeoxyribonuclease-5